MPHEPSSLAQYVETVAGASVMSIIVVTAALTMVRLALQRIPGAIAGWFTEFVDSIVWAAIVVFMLIRPFVIQTFNIPSESMQPTLMVGDYVLVNKAIYRIRPPRVNEIVVFRGPAASLNPGQVLDKTYLIKRCVGAPGDIVEVKPPPGGGDPILWRNGKPVNEPFARKPMTEFPRPNRFKLVDGQPVQYDDTTVYSPCAPQPTPVMDPKRAEELRKAPAGAIPSGKFLMMGDNRPQSFDGRFWGLLDRDRVMGRAEFVWLPIGRIGMAR